MNKLLYFPLGFMLILTIVGMFYNPAFSFSAYSSDFSHTTGGINNSSIDIPNAGSINVNISSSSAIIVLLIGAIAAGIGGGISILGSGLGENAQKIIFMSVVYMGLWTVLSLFASSVIFVNDIMTVLWIVLTILFVIGFSNQAEGVPS